MMITQLLRPKTWASTLMLAGVGVLASAGVIQAQNPHVDADATTVSIGDQMDGDIAQVGFMEDWAAGPSSASCTSCDGCGKTASCCCCVPWWAHRTGMFGEYLLLRPGNTDHIYTIEQNTVVPGNDPTGPIGRVNIDESGGFRVGASWCATECTSLVASYSWFEGHTRDSITPAAGNVLISQILHPGSVTTGTSSLQTTADLNVDFEKIDLGYRHIWKHSNIYAINWMAGLRYGKLEQDLYVVQDIQGGTGPIANDINVDFHGFGMTFGVDGMRRSCHSGLYVYSKALSSFLAGDWRGDYRQVNLVTGGGVVANDYEDYRITPVLELELGLGWQSKCGRFRVRGGYLSHAWYDAINTRQYVSAVRNTNYDDIDETITFNGLTTGVEARF